jgi:hypothetical protein
MLTDGTISLLCHFFVVQKLTKSVALKITHLGFYFIITFFC